VSLAVIYEVTCEHDGCEETFTRDGGSLPDFKREARAWGWVFGRNGEFCVTHVRSH
jgi:hypothetical protein